jgi:hypothetical protein
VKAQPGTAVVTTDAAEHVLTERELRSLIYDLNDALLVAYPSRILCPVRETENHRACIACKGTGYLP